MGPFLAALDGDADDVGIRTFDKLVSATQASSGKVQIMRLGYLGVDTSVERSAYCLSVRNELTNTGKEILIPLTSSLYVPGRLTDVENVVIDVGTGYYVKKVSLLIRVTSRQDRTKQRRRNITVPRPHSYRAT